MSTYNETWSYNKSFEIRARNGRGFQFEQVGMEGEFRLRRTIARLLPHRDAAAIAVLPPHLSERRLREVLADRPAHHVVWAAAPLDGVGQDYAGLGLYLRNSRQGGSACAYVVVDPDLRGLGLGRLLL